MQSALSKQGTHRDKYSARTKFSLEHVQEVDVNLVFPAFKDRGSPESSEDNAQLQGPGSCHVVLGQ